MQVPATFTLLLLFSFCFTGFSQTDTIVMNNQKISCSVLEITSDGVRFTYPQEEIIQTAFKKNIQLLKLKSGRNVTFPEAAPLKTLSKVEDYTNVFVAATEEDVKGLIPLGEVSAKAKGTTLFSNQDRVHKRAYRKMKTEAAMMGANAIFITHQKREGNRYGIILIAGSTAETGLTGMAYSNRLPDPEAFISRVNNKKAFKTTEEYKLWSAGSKVKKRNVSRGFSLSEIIREQGIVTLKGALSGVDNQSTFSLVHFDETSFTIFFRDESRAYQYRINF